MKISFISFPEKLENVLNAYVFKERYVFSEYLKRLKVKLISYLIFVLTCIHTYIIGHYNLSVGIIDLISHTTYIVCVNFMHKWRNLQFKVDSERQIFWKTFNDNFIYSQSFWQKSAERKPPQKYFSYFVLMYGLWLEPWLYV